MTGDTRGLTPPSSASSASNSAVRNSIRVLAAQHRREQQPVRFQSAAQLRQRAGQVADPMQRQIARRQIEACLAKRDQLGVGDDARPGVPENAADGFGRDDPLRAGPGRQRARPASPSRAPRSSATGNSRSTRSSRSISRSAISACRKSIDPARAARSRCARQARRSKSRCGRLNRASVFCPTPSTIPAKAGVHLSARSKRINGSRPLPGLRMSERLTQATALR